VSVKERVARLLWEAGFSVQQIARVLREKRNLVSRWLEK
jgi:hypothetical protein